MAYTKKAWADDAAGNTPITAAELNRMEDGISSSAPRAALNDNLALPLSIPTYDANPNVGHPDVLDIPKGWNGYRYWMGFTPFPGEARENPSVVASHDGIVWEVPTGLVNPVVPLSEATGDGFLYNSDTDLVLLPDGVTMALYYRSASTTTEAVYRKTSTDGVTWGNKAQVLLNATSNDKILSPSVVVEADGTFSLWSVDGSTTPRSLTRRTSADGLTWSAPTTCTIPGVTPWHTDVVRVGGRYFALINDQVRLVLLESTDGLTWSGETAHTLPKSGYTFDQRGFYRSCLVPKAGAPTRFDIYVTAMDGTGADLFSDGWRIMLHRDVDWTAAAAETKRQKAMSVLSELYRYGVIDSMDRLDTVEAQGIGKPDVGPSWETLSGTVNLTGGKMRLAGTAIQAVESGIANAAVSVDITLRASGTADIGLLTNLSDATNYLYLGIVKTDTIDRLRLYKRDAGVYTTLGTDVDPAGMVFGGTYRFEVALSGSVVTVKMDGVTVLTHTLTAGETTKYGVNTKHGLYANNDDLSRFRNFTVRRSNRD